MPRFDVNFSDPKRYFHPGETVAGTVTVRVDEPVRARKIILQFYGESGVSWITHRGNETKFHFNSEEYFKHKDTLLGPASPPEEGIPLDVGDYTYPFQYQLPNCLPPSFVARMHGGRVQYGMKVTVEDIEHSNPHPRDSDIHFKIVATPVDLNETRHNLNPKSKTVEKFLCCLCCQSGPIRLRAELQKEAFNVGELIIFSFELDNKATDKPLRKVEASLMQRVTFYTSSRTEEHEFKISSEILGRGIQPGGEGAWKDVRLNIPADTVPNFECKCFHVKYYFIVSVEIESALDPKVVFPITIVNGVKTVQPKLTPSKKDVPSASGEVVYQPPAGPSPPEYLSRSVGVPPLVNPLQPANDPPPNSGLLSPSNPPSAPASVSEVANIQTITQQPHTLATADLTP